MRLFAYEIMNINVDDTFNCVVSVCNFGVEDG